MATYHLSKKGEDFLDGHYREFKGTGSVGVDIITQWLWWIRESGDFQKYSSKLIKDVGNERAGHVFNWAVHKEYIEKDMEELETCEHCGEQYIPDAPDDWGTHEHHVCNKCWEKNPRAEKSTEERQTEGEDWYRQHNAAIAAMRERMRLQRGE